MRTNTEKGLVFVEMLVVVALIGLFLSIVATAVAETKKQARDALRLVHVQEVSKALALYNIDNNHFPVSKKPTAVDGDDALTRALTKSGAMKDVPRDPLHPDYTYYYVSNPRGTRYLLTYCLETDIFDGKTQGCGNTIEP